MKANDLTRTALMAAVLCVLAPISVPVGSAALSLATFVLYLMAYILKPRQTIAAVGIYLLLGAAGLPVFAGFLGGISRFASPVGGYLIGYLFAAGIGAWFVQKYARISLQFFGLFLATLFLYLFGTLWMAYTTDISFLTALQTGAMVFLPFDVIKILLAAYLGRNIQKHIKRSL
ncbi:MAG: biotin transporter BioY [Anaerotignum sp.]|nr:biotin transporter BioY [Anaerotignum sp.]